MSVIGSAGYLRHMHDPRLMHQTVERVQKAVKKLYAKTKFDAIAFRGMSGASVVYPVSYLTGIPPLCVRKPGENCHSLMGVEGPPDEFLVESYIIVDDLIETGNTMTKIVEALSGKGIPAKQCRGIILYETDREFYGSNFDVWDPNGGDHVNIPVLQLKG
jgi:adenine/guanine phosphoribosyltransferase-like PRPP-binding protein